MIQDLLSADPKRRLAELIPVYFWARSLSLLVLGMASVAVVFWHVQSLPLFENLIFSMAAYVVTMVLANLYLLMIYPLRESYSHPARSHHPGLLFLLLLNYGFTFWLMQKALAANADPYLLLFILTLPSCAASGLKWPVAASLIMVANSAAYWLFSSYIPPGFFLVLFFSQLILLVLFKFVIEEFENRTILNLNLAELQATQSLLKESIEQATRREVARNLHDELGHLVTLISANVNQYLASTAQPDPLIADTRPLINSLGEQVRSIALCLRENNVIDIRNALQLMCGQIRRPQIALTFTGFDGRCPAALGETIFRACQECVTNCLRHSSATRMAIHICQRENRFSVDIQDNGTARHDPAAGSGLHGIRERVLALNGSFTCDSTAQGFLVSLSLPVPATSNPDGS